MEPIYEQRNAVCFTFTDRDEIDVTNLPSSEKTRLEDLATFTGSKTCRNLPNVKVGEIKIVEQEAWTEEVEISPAKEETICE